MLPHTHSPTHLSTTLPIHSTFFYYVWCMSGSQEKLKGMIKSKKQTNKQKA